MGDPRVFQGSPLTEVPLEWLRARYDDDRIDRERATEVAPGVFVQVTAWGDFIMPAGRPTRGAQIAVWAPETAEAVKLGRNGSVWYIWRLADGTFDHTATPDPQIPGHPADLAEVVELQGPPSRRKVVSLGTTLPGSTDG